MTVASSAGTVTRHDLVHVDDEDGIGARGARLRGDQGTLEWQDNERLQHLTVDINTNDNWEPDEHFYINLSQSKGGASVQRRDVRRLDRVGARSRSSSLNTDEKKSLKDRAHWMLNVDDDAMKIGSTVGGAVPRGDRAHRRRRRRRRRAAETKDCKAGEPASKESDAPDHRRRAPRAAAVEAHASRRSRRRLPRRLGVLRRRARVYIGAAHAG